MKLRLSLWPLNAQNALVWILAAAVLLRVGAALYLGDTVVELPGTADQVSYHNLALRVLGGHGFSFAENWWPATRAGEPTAHWSFLYTLYLVGVYGLFGAHPLAARLIQAVLVGLLQPYLAYRIGKQAFGEPAGLVAAGLTAGYAYFIYYAGCLMTESFYISALLGAFLLAIQIASALREPSRPGAKPALAGKLLVLGACLGAAILLRQLVLLFVPFLLAWMLYAGWKTSWKQKALLLLVPVLVIAIFIAPFTLYNQARFGRFVLLNTNAGYAFFLANHPIYGTHFIPILAEGQYGELLPPELLHLDEAALDQALLKRGLEFVLADPGRYVLLSLSRIPPFFTFWPSGESGLASNLTRLASFAWLWPFMLFGLWRSRPERKAGWAAWLASPACLLALFALVYTGIHVLTWTLVRYRLPVDSAMLVFAGLALYDLYGYVASRRAAAAS